jgi:hypothetical protein
MNVSISFPFLLTAHNTPSTHYNIFPIIL